MSDINISGYAVGVQTYHPQNNPAFDNYVDGVFGVLGRNDAQGGITVSGLTINSSNILSLPYPGTANTNYPYPGTFITNESGGTFTFTFLTLLLSDNSTVKTKS